MPYFSSNGWFLKARKYTIKYPINIEIPPQSGIGPLCFFLFVGLSVKLYRIDNFISIGVNIATIDYLTQVNNRHGLAKRIQELNQKVSSYDLVVFDIDNFKSINDNFGHLIGDEVLKDFAYELTVYFRSENVARFGGEEFIVLSTLEREELAKVLEMFQQEFNSRKYNKQGKEFTIGFSAGVAKCKKSSSHEKALRTADKLLYKSKSLGKGQIFFDEENK